MSFFGYGDIMFTIVPLMVTIGFICVFGMIIVTAIRGIKEWNKNNASPVLTVEATLVSKRTNVSHSHHTDHDNMMHTSTSTTYYVTFEVASGDRMEFRIDGREYGMLLENDKGKLTFQGTRYLGFERYKNQY